MAKTVPLEEGELRWAREQFARYYARASIDPPSRLGRREFAAFPFSNEALMRRHASFADPQEFRDYLIREVPRHVYYSSAYYRKPAEPTMGQKEWLGADLIFDLDADHLRGAESLDYPQQLSRVKEKLQALIDDFLLRDFGVDPNAMSVVFSGGRGYHVHVREPRFLPMTSPERREVVDYLSGEGFDASTTVARRREREWTTGAEAEEAPTGRRASAVSVRHLAPPDSAGWTGRTTRAVLDLLGRWEREGADAARAEIESMGFARAKARTWAADLITKGGARAIREDPTLGIPPHLLPDDLLQAILKRAEIVVQGETDAPVTTDVHRLIRLPGSLHGGTGLRVVPLDRERLEAFDPFRDAVALGGEGAKTWVEFTASVRYPFPPDGLAGSAGEAARLPTPTALFLVLRGEARLRPGPS